MPDVAGDDALQRATDVKAVSATGHITADEEPVWPVPAGALVGAALTSQSIALCEAEDLR